MFVGVVVENFHKCRENQEKEERAKREAKRNQKKEQKIKSERSSNKLLAGILGLAFCSVSSLYFIHDSLYVTSYLNPL